MRFITCRRTLFSFLALSGLSLSAHAQIPVTDVGAIFQLITEVNTLAQELQVAQQDLAQAQQAYQAITGTRGMQNLLSGTQWNYLPSDWTQLQGMLNGGGATYSALAGSVQGSMAANAVLTSSELAALSSEEQSDVQARRQSAALAAGIAQQALATTSARFASIQQLINAIPTATDEKGILDLQARIGAEQGMLQNDSAKLGVLYQIAQAQELAEHQHEDEQSMADVGSMRRLPPMGL
jgi:type IV secretion system protein VirB5